jgi:hypothetical protein
MSDEAWLMGRNLDASKELFVATGVLLCNFELFIGELVQKKDELTTSSSCGLFDDIGCLVSF